MKFSSLPGFADIIARDHPNGLKLNNSEIERILSASCLSVTLPPINITTTDFNGLGGIRWTAPTAIDQGNDVSMRFLESQDTPIRSIFSAWVRLIRDYRVGAAIEFADTMSGYTRPKYATDLYYWTTTPDAKRIQFAACLSGIYPTKDPVDMFGHDVTANDKLEIDIDFRTDYVFTEKWVADKCLKLHESMGSKKVVDGIMDSYKY